MPYLPLPYLLMQFVSTAGLHQFVQFATRGENVLDLVLSTDNRIISGVSSGLPLGHSDHVAVNFTLGLNLLEPAAHSPLVARM